ncbi:SapC family protein [Halomonas sp. A11-A]|uniref:SapC family protein n=1 Tax=Halomonas sp. A11-A TaxID=2183985 RepID=UPI000D9116CF|nr:SapC family protein [Halomonas sp. A11-A]PWV71497.1 SapC protein [Halomonas sp. A11-A]
MTTPLVLSPKECQGKTWHPPVDLAFATHQALLPLHAGELAKAAASMPLALVKEGREWRLVGVCGLETGHNLFLKDGKWLGNYRPAWLATWPFAVVAVGEKGIVTFDRDSGLEDPHGAGEPFFDDAGQMREAVATRVEALKTHHRKHQATHKALQALARAKVITPWPEALTSQLGLAIDGLHMIDERALSQLDDEAFLALRKAQALPIAYALNLSIPQTHLLARLARLNPASQAAPDNLDELFGEGDDEFVFNFDS